MNNCNMCRTCGHFGTINNSTDPVCKIGKYRKGMILCDFYEEELTWVEKQLMLEKANLHTLVATAIGLYMFHTFFPETSIKLKKGIAIKILMELKNHKILKLLEESIDNIDFFDEFDSLD